MYLLMPRGRYRFRKERAHALACAVQSGLDSAMTDTEVRSYLVIAPAFGVFEQQDFGIFVRQSAERSAHISPLLRREQPIRRIGRLDVVLFDPHPLGKSLGKFSATAALTAVEKNLLY